MLRVQQVTSDVKQKHSLVLPNGNILKLRLRYASMQYGWFITELSYLDFTLRNIRITNFYNILHQFKNKIPFGLACLSKDAREPMLIEDFETEHSSLYILTEEEVLEFTGTLSE